MTELFYGVAEVLGSVPIGGYTYADKKWDQFLFKSDAFIRLGTLLIQKAAYYVPGESESRNSIESTYQLYLEAKDSLRDNYDVIEERYPNPPRRIELALNEHANLIMLNEAKIGEAKKRLIF